VPVDAQGQLSYPSDAVGNRIPDFSNAGYRGGGVALPAVPVVRTLTPTSGDQTIRIQAALDEVAALPLAATGYRGALQLAAGTWEVTSTIRLRANGVVLSGVGEGDDPAGNTILRRTGTSQTPIIQAGNRNDGYRGEITGSRAQITTPYVFVGSHSFEVDRPELYRVGDAIIVWQPSTQAWLDAVNRGGVSDANFWKPGEIDLRYHRYITAISGNTLTVDAPIFNPLDRTLSQSYVYKYDAAHVLRNIGIEQLQVDIVTRGELTEDHAEDAIRFVGVEDSWIRDTMAKHFWHAGVQWEGSTRCTAERCRAIEPHGPIDGGYRYNFSMYQAQLILVQDCFASRGRHNYVCNGTSLDAGIVFLNCVSDQALTSSEGHRRWSTGLLYDNLTATNRQSTDILGLYNRGTYGTGHGWAAAHSVAWNCNASAGGRIWIQRPPTAQNYGIGCIGNVTGNGPFPGPAGYIEGTNQPGLEPRSLYLAQLAQRLANTGGPKITTPPVSHHVIVGDPVIFTVTATGANLTYQWLFNGTAIPGATDRTLRIASVTAAEAGEYRVRINDTAIATASLSVGVADESGLLINVSVRSRTDSGVDTLIVGIGVGGVGATGTHRLLFRAAGPALSAFGVSSPLADPALTVFQGRTVIASNDDWMGSTATAAVRVNAFAYPSLFSKDAAQEAVLPIGSYSMQVTPASGVGGVALAEIYDATQQPGPFYPGAPRLTNVSARSQAGRDAEQLIAGFTLGRASKTVLIRAVGPGLTQFGVTGQLADPKLELYSGSTLLATNDNWEESAGLTDMFTRVGAFPLAPGSRDAAMVITLKPGGYTAQVSGVANTTGVALVEVYTLNP
jgi:hypothetical protein